MEEMPSLSKPVQRLKVATRPLDLPYSGPVTHSGDIFNHWQVSRKETGQILFKLLSIIGSKLREFFVKNYY